MAILLFLSKRRRGFRLNITHSAMVCPFLSSQPKDFREKNPAKLNEESSHLASSPFKDGDK